MSTTDWWNETTNRIDTWHTEYFPDATPEQVGLKIAEEAGEVARAVGNWSTGTRRNTDWRTEAMREAGDVFVALVGLARVMRFDLRAAIEWKVDEVTARKPGTPEENNR